jgi:hypothetical protein
MSVVYTSLPFPTTPRPRREYRPTGLGTRCNIPGWPETVHMLRTAIAVAKTNAPQSGGPSAEHLACTVIDRVGELGVCERHLLAIVLGILLRRSRR